MPVPLSITHENGVAKYNTTLIVKLPKKSTKALFWYAIICALILNIHWTIRFLPKLVKLICDLIQ